MRGLRESKPDRRSRPDFVGNLGRHIPRPCALGVFVILVTVLAFAAGHLRQELALSLLGAVFLAILTWCFLAVLILGVVHRKRALSLSADIVTKLITAGENGEARITAGTGDLRFFCLPGILLRYELKLFTRDGRIIRHIFDPKDGRSRFPVKCRGAYYGTADEFTISDASGFFHLSFPTPREHYPRLLAAPHPAEELISLPIRSGGTEQRIEPHYRKTDDLTNHRPYVPGDDPRRINWKLYGHGPAEELFVREGESEPPPRARILILIETQTDPSLFTAEEGREAVDLLCENALAAALEFSSRGMDILLGYTGGEPRGEDAVSSAGIVPAELAAALALPAALPLASADDLPGTGGDRSVLILALPRSSAEPGALDRFLRNRAPGQGADLFFLYDIESPHTMQWETAADSCVGFYNKKPGVRACRFATTNTAHANPQV